jgi:hypothetical protein
MTVTVGMAAIISRAPRPEPEHFFRARRQDSRRTAFSFPRLCEQWQSSSTDSRPRLMNAPLAALKQRLAQGDLLSRHPLLIQKTVADKLSDKVRVIIAPVGTDGRFIASGLIGDAAKGQGGDADATGAQ